MNNRTLGGISACVAYVVWIAAWWAIVLLAQIQGTCQLALLAMLPLLVPILIADSFVGVLPGDVSELVAGNPAVAFGSVLAITFIALYWIGWWTEALKETPTVAAAPQTVNC